jgi:hypothetical protein
LAGGAVGRRRLKRHCLLAIIIVFIIIHYQLEALMGRL